LNASRRLTAPAGRVPARRVWCAAALAWLGGCASLAPPLPAPDLAGRLAVNVDASTGSPARSFSADFDLRGNAERGLLRLTGPLGATLAEVRWQPGAAELSDGQGTRRFDTLDAMSQALFGEPLPLAALLDWLRGRPWSGAPSQPRDDGFEQMGWRVGLTGFADGRLQATRDRAPTVTVRARVERPA
jgi:outer membrane lipoprotein LolB